jgi:2-polyprenyl-3-methyl-5-hydroxy-6-metoxy-1,4-benzoquinol methylase
MSSKLPTLDEQSQFWNWHWQHWRERNTINEWKERRHEAILSFLKKLPLRNPQILDLGCGPGWYTKNLALYGEVTGLDLSDDAIKVAQTKYPHITFHAGNLYDFPLPVGHYDVVVAQEVFDHVEDQSIFIDRVSQLLIPHGYLILSCTNKFVMDRLREGAFPSQPSAHIAKYLDMKGLRHILSSSFRVMHIKSIIAIAHLMEPRGVVRIINSYKLNHLLNRFISPQRLDSLKVWLGFGYQLIALAQKKF